MPAPPHAGVLLVIGKSNADWLDVLFLAAPSRKETDPVTHSVTLIAVVAHDVPVKSGGQGREPSETTKQRSVGPLRWQSGSNEAHDPIDPHVHRDDEEIQG